MKLTEITCKNAKHDNPKSKAPKKLSDGQGLSLWVMPNGSKYWKFAYRYGGKQKTLSIGVYPDISLKQARAKRVEAKDLLNGNQDPSLEKKKQKIMQVQDSENTFQTVALEWYDNRKDIWKPRYAAEVIKRLEEDIFPEIGDYPIKDIEPLLLLQTIRKIEKRGALDLAKRQLQKCGEIFRYAIATGRGVRDPSQDIKEALKPVKKTHFAALDPEELPELLKDINTNKARLYPTTINAMKLMLLTFVRTKELIEGTWDEIDFERKLWTIPAERMKMGKEHIVPLADQTIAILKEQKEIARHWPHLFPSPNKPRQSISNNTILVALKRMGYQGRMTGHGFRALAMSTIKQELHYRHEVVDRQLAHVPKSKIDRAYDRAMFLEERKKMMQDWADYIDRIYR
jgi:integrase